jgi:MoaF N-terminal domain
MTAHPLLLGRKFLFDFGDNAKYELHFAAADALEVTVVADASYPTGTLNTFTIATTELRPDLYMVTWVEEDTGNTVTHVQDYENLVAYTNITDLASRGFWNLHGTITPIDSN